MIISIDGFAAYSLRDESLPVPTLRRLIRAGAVADAMETVNPTVTWPNHTSMITGVRPSRHQVIYNGMPMRNGAGQALTVEPWLEKSELVQAPTLYDAAHAAGLTSAEVDWVAIHNAKTITWAFPEVPRLTDPIVREMIAAGTITEAEAKAAEKTNIVWRDEVWTLAGQHIIEKHRPNLLLFHLLTTDSAQHRYGASSLAGNTALALADSKVQRLIDSLRRANILDRSTIFIVSDHGFKTYRNLIRPNALLKQKNLLGDVWCISEGGTAMVYITRPERRAELLPVLRASLSTLPGVSRIIGSDEFAGLGYPPVVDGGRMADLVLAAADGYAFDGTQQGEPSVAVPAGATPGSHGYLNTDPQMDAIFIASGAGVKANVRLTRVRNIDIAPTAARILGLSLGNIEGRVLTEILA